MSIFIQLNSNEILTLNQFAGQKTDRKHTENIVDEINTALYNRDKDPIYQILSLYVIWFDLQTLSKLIEDI